ncbi:MAG: amidohydrolase family protein, partial [Rhodospirillales bacterium]|nr:amidohydrolase family protein [Rhodospirillales bacterium]
MAEEILIRGGTVIDGTGAAGVRADVAVRGGRIASVGTDMVNSSARVIEADGRIVAPGFIDIKTHSDWTLPLMPQCESKVRQGVTTEVIGHCGFSCAPALPGKAEALAEYLGPSAPWLTFVETDYADYAANFPATSVNRVMLVGHNTLRLMTMGMEDRAPEPAELDHMKALLEDALAAGAFGMSSGLFTAPGSYSEGEELVELGAILKRHDALYFTHLRDESNQVYEAVDEATEFGERTGVHVQIVHIKLSGMDNWGGADKLITQLRDARARGVKIDCDQYPYVAASNPLKNLMPSWLQEGGVDAMLERLGQREVRDRIRAEINDRGLNNFGRIPDWDAIRISISPNQPPDYAGRTMGDIARERGADPFETVLDYIVEDRGQSRVLVSSISEDDVRAFVRDGDVMVGSDGNSVAPYGTTGQGKPHPRFYGTFARILGQYVRDENLLPIERAIWKMTGAPARALCITARGQIKPGMAA